jgi:ParB family chromosome partitioning protein
MVYYDANMETIVNNSIFWVETDKISPNPYQPRREFDEHALRDLADSIRQYGLLQPLTVTRKEVETPDGGLSVSYELIAGERRLRASKLAGVPQVPVIIRSGVEDAKLKLELAIIENLQREDLNAIDRAVAFQKLHTEFHLSHGDIGKRMGKSREYVSNTLRLLSLPSDIQTALAGGKLGEGHARTLLSLNDKPDEQMTLFQEILVKKLSVRETESIARTISRDKVRKKELVVPETVAEYQEEIGKKLGTRVYIEPREQGGRLVIDFMSPEDLEKILQALEGKQQEVPVVRPEEILAPSQSPAIRPSLSELLRQSLEKSPDTHEFPDFTV